MADSDKSKAAAKCAQQAVAQSTAMAVQDAVDNMRNLNTLTTTAMGVALAQLLATGDPKYVQVIEESQKIVAKSAEQFAKVSADAAKVLKDFS